MKVIVLGQEANVKFWKQSVKTDVSYRLTRYHVQAECDDGMLLLNTVTGEMVLLSEAEMRMLSKTVIPYSPALNDLIIHHFLVPENSDDLNSVTQLRKLLGRIHAKGGITSYSILPTTTCNAKCFYCFESNYPRHTMTEETANKVADFIEANCGTDKSVQISWFGGEPTVASERITQICNRLREKGINYKSSMYSNGYLLTSEIVK